LCADDMRTVGDKWKSGYTAEFCASRIESEPTMAQNSRFGRFSIAEERWPFVYAIATKNSQNTVTVRMNFCGYNQKPKRLRLLLVLSTHRPRSVYKSHRKLAKGRVEVDRG